MTRRGLSRRAITRLALALAATGSIGLGAVQWRSADAADRLPPIRRLVEAKTFQTRTYHDDKIKAYVRFTVNPNGDVNWSAHVEFVGEPARVFLLNPFSAFYQRVYAVGCSIVDPFGLILSRYDVTASMRAAAFGEKETKTWTDFGNPNIKRHIERITFGPGVIERSGLRDDGVNYTYDCVVDDRGNSVGLG